MNQNNSETRADYMQTVATISTWVNTDCDRRQNECTQALQELVEDFGAQCVVRGIMDTTAADKIAKLGGDQTRLAKLAIMEIRRCKNDALSADLVCLAIGLGDSTGISLSTIAKTHGCTKQGVSKQLIAICQRLGLPPLQFQLDQKARESYRLTNRRNHGATLTR